MTETSVGRTFGLTDMYRDFADATNQHYLEEQLSKLESRAAGIISKIRKAFEAQEGDVWLIRTERDILRKFLFIMKYRGSGMHKRFYDESAEDYHANDRDRLLQYMKEKGFRKPVDVWFDNIKGMLELKMDSNGRWMRELQERIYPDDAIWFIAHTQMMYLACCSTAIEDDEFLLTENAYSIHEGPNSYRIDPQTGEQTPTAYTEYHVFAVISPKLIMVLRSFLLPVPEEDNDEEIGDWRKTMYQLNIEQHNYPLTSGSVLADLPIAKPRNSYSKIVDGRVVLLDGEDGTPRADHKYYFRFFPLETDHANKINTIMLEESTMISKIVFKSYSRARKTFEHYLSLPPESGFKYVPNVPGVSDDPRIIFLMKLEEAVKKMGSSVTASYQTRGTELMEQREMEAWGELFEKNLPKEPTEPMKLYINLGGSGRTMPKDMEQARRMLNMRIKVDVWSQGLDENFRNGIRRNVRDLFCQLPVRRVWFYLKMVRQMILGSGKVGEWENSGYGEESSPDEPENVIAKVSGQLRSHGIAQLLWLTVMNHIHFVQNPYLDLEAEISFNPEGMMQFQSIRAVTFSQSGSICDCPIPEIEEEARSWKSRARAESLYHNHKSSFWTEEENIELFTRRMTRGNFVDLLGKKLSAADLQALEMVLFTISYPIANLRYQS